MSTPDLTPISADESAGSKPAAPAAKIVVPAIEPVVWPRKKSDGKPFKLQLPPPRVWEYRLGDGSLFGVVARWDRDGDKIVLPAVCVDGGDAPVWAWQGFGEGDGSRPLLGLIELAAKPLATVLVVEGEKTRDAAARYMPENWVCVTWQGGGKAIGKTDWAPLAGRRVVLWMDKDSPPTNKKTGEVLIDKNGKPQKPPGEQTGLDLFVMLSDIGAGVAMVPVYGPRMQMLPANGWDLADDCPPDFEPREWMENAAKQINVPQQRIEPSRSEVAPRPKLVVDNSWGDGDEPPPPDDGSTDARAEYKALGYSQTDGRPLYHFFSGRTGLIVTVNSKEILGISGIYSIVNNENYWRAQYDLPRADFQQMPWRIVGQKLQDECIEAGYFEIEKERGRGAWLDDTGPDGKQRVIMHLGQNLVVDGKLVNPSKLKSKYYYPIKHRLMTLKQTAPLSDAEGKLIRQILRSIAWKKPFHAELCGGWLASAPICGAMPWRTHFWIQGPAGSGKSWIVDNIIKPCLGDLALKPLGNSSAAGIMGTLGRDARPVIYDEAEAKGSHGEDRRQMIIELMRYSSSQSDGEVIKGTATHGTVGFSVKTQFFLASIGVGISEQADTTRTVVAEILKRPPEDGSFDQLVALVKKLPKDLPEKLLRRQLSQLRTIRENAETFSRVISLQLGSARLGDMIGTLMAGDHSLVSDRIIEFEEAEQRVADRLTKKQFVDFLRVKEAGEDVDLLRHMLSFSVQAQGPGGVRYDRPLGELLYTAVGKFQDDKLTQFQADDALRRIGVQREKVDGVDGFWIARQKQLIATRIMSTSTYSQGWDRILATMDGAVESEQDHSFAGTRLPALWLPFATMVMGVDNAQKAGRVDATEEPPDPSLV
jgi:putative DNA primase/helicase